MDKVIPALPERILIEIEEDGRRRSLGLIDAAAGARLQTEAAGISARRILEVGGSIGYSGIWLARALPSDGLLITIEHDPKLAAEAADNFQRTGLSERVTMIAKDPALILHKIAGPFDMVFLNGVRQPGSLLDRLIALLRAGGLLAHRASAADTNAGENDARLQPGPEAPHDGIVVSIKR